MMFHPSTKTLIRFTDNDLAEQKFAKVASHLKGCARCRKKQAFLGHIEAVNKSKRTLSRDFKEGLIANLKDVKRSRQPIVAEIKKIMGVMLVFRNGDEEGVEGFPGMGLRNGYTVKLIGDSRALVELNDGSHIYLNKDTEINLPSARYNLAMRAGEIFAMMKPQKKTFLVQTPSALLGVVGTEFDAKVTERKQTVLQVVKGSVYFKNDSGNVLVRRRRQVEATPDVKPVPVKIRDARTISAWTGTISPKKKQGAWIMKKLTIVVLAVFALLVVVGAGYWLYNELFGYEPYYYRPAEPAVAESTSPELSSPPATPAIADSEPAVPSAPPEQPSEVEKAEAPVTLPSDETMISRVQMQPGKRYILQVDQISDGTTNRSDSPRPQKSQSRYYQQLAFSLLGETPGGGQEVELEFLRVAMQMDMPEGKAYVDSAAPTPPEVKEPMAQALWGLVKAMSGIKLRMYVNADGEVERMDGLEQLMEKIKASCPPMMVTMLQGFLNEDTMKEMSKLYGEALPKHPVKVGDSWDFKAKMEVPMLGKLRTNINYHFSKWEEHMGRACAVLEMNGTISGKSGSNGLLPGVQMSLKDSTISGKTWYDPTIGMNIDSTITQNLTMDINAKVRGRRGTREEKATIRQTQYTTTRLIGVEDIK